MSRSTTFGLEFVLDHKFTSNSSKAKCFCFMTLLIIYAKQKVHNADSNKCSKTFIQNKPWSISNNCNSMIWFVTRCDAAKILPIDVLKMHEI